MKKELELYLHIPFCMKKCEYCDFLSFCSDQQEQKAYLKALQEEIRSYTKQADAYQVTSIFIGGGTPSILVEGEIGKLFQTIYEVFTVVDEAEITLEMNPGTVTKEKLAEYQQAGINRLSIGLQSADETELQMLGRIHTWGQFKECYELARTSGFTNINVDLISAIPGQTLTSWRETLRQVTALKPEHISAYSLIIEAGTNFYNYYVEQQGEGFLPLPKEEAERQMYLETQTYLKQYGYERYEISNYARPGYECRHNLGYWDGKEYLGLGLGAASLVDHVRFSNQRSLSRYLKGEWHDEEEREQLSVTARQEEFMFLGLRKTAGIKKDEFEAQFGVPLNEVYGTELERLKKERLIEEDTNSLRLTLKGMDLANYVFSAFII